MIEARFDPRSLRSPRCRHHSRTLVNLHFLVALKVHKGKALSDQYLAPGAAVDAHRSTLGPGRPDELRVGCQIIASWIVSGHPSVRGTPGFWGAGAPLAWV